MKNTLLFLMALLALGACSKKDLGISFRMNYEEEVVIPSSVGINLPFTIQSPPITTNSESKFSNNNTSANRVSSIRLEEMQLILDEPSEADFSFLESIYILISAQGLPDDTIAWQDPVTSNASVLNLTTTELNLKPYLVKDEFSLKTITLTDEFISEDHRITIKSGFRVEAEIFN